MKKTILFLSCSLVLMVMAGCKKGPVLPSISVLHNQGCVIENSQVYYGGEITVGFSCTGENLNQLDVVLMQNDSILARHTDSLGNAKNEPVPPYIYKHPFTLEVLGPVTVTGTLTDAQGQVATVSFDINYNETPNMRFVGHFEGDLFINGSYSADLSLIGLQDGDLDSIAFYTIADIVTGDNMNEVVATLTLGDNPNTVRGTVDGDNIIFDEISSTFVFDYSYDGLFTINIPIELDVIYSMHGTLTDGVLYLEGDCHGGGDISIMGGIINGPMTMEGTLGGSLTKCWKR
jgi:hypothetical protein